MSDVSVEIVEIGYAITSHREKPNKTQTYNNDEENEDNDNERMMDNMFK
jgi:hypothetical protein